MPLEFEPSIAERLLYILVALARDMNLMASGSHLPNSKSHQGKPRKTSSRSMAPLLTLRHNQGTTSLSNSKLLDPEV